MNRKIYIVGAIMLILIIAIPMVHGVDIETSCTIVKPEPARDPKDKLVVVGIAQDITNLNTYQGYQGLNYVSNDTDITVTHYGKDKLYLRSIDAEYKDVTIRIFRDNVNVIDIKDYTGLVYRFGMLLIMFGTHYNFNIHTW